MPFDDVYIHHEEQVRRQAEEEQRDGNAQVAEELLGTLADDRATFYAEHRRFRAELPGWAVAVVNYTRELMFEVLATGMTYAGGTKTTKLLPPPFCKACDFASSTALESLAEHDAHGFDAVDAVAYALRCAGTMRARCDAIGLELSHRLLRPARNTVLRTEECNSLLLPPI